MPQLDSLRTFAVLFVLIDHWIPGEQWFKIFRFGMVGVTMFFVLSGFLITQILLQSRKDNELNGRNNFHSIKQFYIRRTLRIFPVYYVTLFFLWIFNIQSIRDKIIWFLLYASNIYFYEYQKFDGSLSHLWTLAVEEQFYIIWPFIILFTPSKYLFKTIIAITVFGIFFSPLSLYFSDVVCYSTDFLDFLTPSCMDSFGLGAILAYFRVNRNEMFKFEGRNFYIIFSAVILMVFVNFYTENIFAKLFYNFNISLLSLFLISRSSIGFKGLTGKILDNKVLIYLGKISYGLYLFHNFIPLIWKSLNLPVINNVSIRFIIYFLVLTALASLSWYILEKPVNSLKKRFVYSG